MNLNRNKAVEIAGKRFGRLVAIKFTHFNKFHKSCWDFKCDCGNITNTIASAAIRNRVLSCGCLAKERRLMGTRRYGDFSAVKLKVYHLWSNMLNRCYNKNNKDYNHYGGRGISVCDQWRNDFMAFYKYMGNRPGPKYVLDRINVNGNYEPGNVRWATMYEQQNNKRNNVYYNYKGSLKTISELARLFGWTYGRLYRIAVNDPNKLNLILSQ